MLIRPATKVDIVNIQPMIAKICALHKLWDSAKFGFLPHPEQRYENWLARLIAQPKNLCLVAEHEDKLIAFAIAGVEQEIPIYELKDYGFIYDLWVEEEYRQQGIAKQMVEQIITHFQKFGIRQIRLETASVNDKARKLFAECGFRTSSIEMLIEL